MVFRGGFYSPSQSRKSMCNHNKAANLFSHGAIKTEFPKITRMRQLVVSVAIAVLLAGCQSHPAARVVAAAQSPDVPPVIAPPESYFQRISEGDRDAARKFYKKYIDVKGLPVTASAEVD